MDVSLGERWECFIERAVSTGRYTSAREVICEGLRLLEQRETKLKALRETVNDSIAGGEGIDDGALDAFLEAQAAAIVRRG
ncbi:type II toxin-antitoxin system ParD family antitoxin [Rhizobiales bacterium Sp-1]|uniref:Type II toxin-antitoxin system ParD family antitoxin n=1 Tax=Segnochrobactrum spirostomi TaxID=2608987 RepID=A0A6A7Y8C9_9HYPH|nr:type II toxin-antitoxin system ParD family antitoxin [Segnochrobactrum spirostomi]